MTQGREHVRTEQTAKMVRALTAYGIPRDQIAKLAGCHRQTIETYYPEELELGTAQANAQVAERLFKIATAGDEKVALSACIFWLKTRGKWRTSETEELLNELEVLRSKLIEAEERLARLGTPKLVA